MPFLGTIWILPKCRPNSNFGAIFTGPAQAVEMAQKFEIRLEIVRIQIIPKNGIFNHSKTRLRKFIAKQSYQKNTESVVSVLFADGIPANF